MPKLPRDKLLKQVKDGNKWKLATDDPLFPSATGRPDGAMLEKLKAVAGQQR